VALYESLAMPLAVLFSIAIALLGAMVALRLSGLSADLFAHYPSPQLPSTRTAERLS
jgi:multidrug efflux pump subunit AcrB